MLQIYHGDGKGKTTAAIGLCIRAVGAGEKVIFAQFMKGNESSELAVLRSMEGVQVLHIGKQFGFYKNMSDAEKTEMTELHNALLRQILDTLKTNEADVVILDEFQSACGYELMDTGLVEKIYLWMREKELERELVMTGRNPKEEWTQRADYITCMHPEKHPFEAGVMARIGIEM